MIGNIQSLTILYNEIIKSNEHCKDDYKYNTLIGDNTLFIQDKTTKSIFYYFNPDNNLELDYIFIFKEEISFYNEIDQFIKGKGFEKIYITKRIINHNFEQIVHELADRNRNGKGELKI